MKILMTGSSGPKVGKAVAAKLAGVHDLIGFDQLPGMHTTHLADITAVSDWQSQLEGVNAVVHFAALHAPHRETHSRAAFQALNVDTTARLLDAARSAGVRKFLLASSTSVYGHAKQHANRAGCAAWVTEALIPEAEDIYDETKLAAEARCRDAFRPDFQTAALRFSRCFPEPPRDMALYRLYRGVGAADVAAAFEAALVTHFTAFEAFNISGATPFEESDCEALWCDAPGVLAARAPELVSEFQRRGWTLPASIDRVYVCAKAAGTLAWSARQSWASVL